MQDSLSLNDALFIVLKHIRSIIAVTIIGGVLAALYSVYMITPMYESTGSFYVYNQSSSASSSATSSYVSSDFTIAHNLTNNILVYTKSDSMLQAVIDDCGLNYSKAQLRGMLTVSSIEDSAILNIRVVSPDANDSAAIVNSILNVMPTKIKDTLLINEIKVIDRAVYNQNKVSPSNAKNAILGAFAGFVLSVIIAFAIELLNTSLKNTEDFKKHYDIPVLGEIPSTKLSTSKANGGYHNEQ